MEFGDMVKKMLEKSDVMKRLQEHMLELNKVFGAERYKAIPFFEDAICYPEEAVMELYRLSMAISTERDEMKRDELIAGFAAMRDSIRPIGNAPERIYLWPEGKVPTMTEYLENIDYQYNRGPDFVPYMYEMLVPEDVEPKGAVVVCAGGDHGDSTIYEGYQVCRELNELGYQCFCLLNRPKDRPWNKQECGADAARAIRIIRKNADKYRIPADRVAYAGFSNGGLTGEACIQYYSGEQKVSDHFDDYEPDEFDAYYGAPDVFLCIYGPRWKGDTFDYSKVVYPPTFMAVGRKDFVMENMHAAYNDLVEHNVPVEIHTFAGAPHGIAGKTIIDGKDSNPGFQLWLPLADYFMQDVYANKQ